MKKLHLFSLVLLFIIASCTTTKIERQSENQLKGNWTLSQIVSDEGNSVVITKMFDKSSVECFEGSTWNFVENNYSGNYTLDGMSCDTTPQNFNWYVKEDGANTYFYFKHINAGEKAKNVTSGYKMQLISVDETQAHMMHEVPFDGGKMAIHYYFIKQ